MTRGLASHRGAPVTSPATVVPASHSACVALSGWGTRRQKRRKRFVEGRVQERAVPEDEEASGAEASRPLRPVVWAWVTPRPIRYVEALEGRTRCLA